MSKSKSAFFAIITITCLGVLLIGAKPTEKALPPDGSIFGGVWLDPNATVIPAEQVVFKKETTGNFDNQSDFYMGRSYDGWHFMVSLFTWKYGPIHTWGAYALVVSPEGKRYFAKHQFEEKNITLGKDRLFVQDGPNVIDGKDGVYKVKFNFENFSCDLTYTCNVSALRPGDGYAWLSKPDNIYQFAAIPCPWADVSGTIKLPDRTVQIKGEGYSDRTRSNSFPTKLAPYLYSIRVFSPGGTPREERWMFGVFDQQAHPTYGSRRVPFLHLSHNNKTVMFTKIYDLETTEWQTSSNSPYDYPKKIKVRAKDRGWILEGEYTSGPLFDFLDVLAEVPAWARNMALKFVKRPIFFRSPGSFEANITAPDGTRSHVKLIGPIEYVVVK